MALERWHSISKSWVVVEVVVSKVKWLVISLVVLLQSVTGHEFLVGREGRSAQRLAGRSLPALCGTQKAALIFINSYLSDSYLGHSKLVPLFLLTASLLPAV